METPKKSSVECPVVPCILTVENLTPQGTVKKTAVYKDVNILLGRNEFK